MKIVIRGRPATAKNGNTPFFNRKTGKMMAFKKASLRRWETGALRQITGDMKKRIGFPVNVEVKIWIMEDRRCDLVGFLQAVDDMLVRAGVLEDDSGWHKPIVASHDGSQIMGVDRKEPRIEITITDFYIYERNKNTN